MKESKFLPLNNKKNEKNAKELTMAAWAVTGSRFFTEQSTIELLCEFLLVMTSQKVLKYVNKPDETVYCRSYFFDVRADGDLCDLSYYAPVRLTLKLFSLFGTDNSSKPFPAHQYGYDDLMCEFRKVFSRQYSEDTINDYINVLEATIQGFQIAGVNRDWCAKSFIPISENFLAAETIWKETEARRSVSDGQPFRDCVKYFVHNSRDFYSRGGEVLYLQLLLALSAKDDDLCRIRDTQPLFKDLEISDKEKDPTYLSASIEAGINLMLNSDSSHISKLIKLVEDIGKKALDIEDDDRFYYCQLSSGWVPDTDVTLALGYIFAIELSRLFSSDFEAVKRVTELELECSMQVLRTYLYASAMKMGGEMPCLVTVSPFSTDSRYKAISNNSFKEAMSSIRAAIREMPDLSQLEDDSVVKQAKKDSRQVAKYGASVFKKISKSIGFVVPKKGDTEHFVITKDLLTLFVSTALRPGEPMTFDDFLADLRRRYGIAMDGDSLTSFNRRVGINQKITDPDICSWLVEMLDESGYYQPLSDSISLVINNNEALVGGERK